MRNSYIKPKHRRNVWVDLGEYKEFQKIVEEMMILAKSEDEEVGKIKFKELGKQWSEQGS